MSIDLRVRLRARRSPVATQRPRLTARPRRPAHRHGQAVVEFALILPVFLFLVVMALDFGRLFFSYVQVNNAAREGANYGQGAPSDVVGITARVDAETNVQGQAGEAASTVTASCATPAGTAIACSSATGGGGAGNTVTVKVHRPFSFLTPLMNNFFGGSFGMDATATAAVLGYAPGASATQPPGCSSPSAAFTVIVTSGRGIFVDPTGSTPNSGVCNISGYNWDWGDGDTDVGTATGSTHTYGADGTYTVVLEVTNQAGSASISHPATVPAPVPTPTPTPGPTATPTPGPTATPTAAPTPTPVVCTAPVANFTWTTSGNGSNTVYTYRDASTSSDPTSCPITDWLWTFTNTTNTSSNAQNPAPFSYNNNSNHPVTLRVTNSAGQSSQITKNT